MNSFKINPLDLNPNIAVGISLPFNGDNAFNLTYTTEEQVKSDLKNLLLTNKGERIFQPNFGCGLRNYLFENHSTTLIDDLEEIIKDQIEIWMPYIGLKDVKIEFIEGNSYQSNNINISIFYFMGDSTNIKTITYLVQ